MVGVIPDYNDIGTCNNITHAGLKLFLMPINSSHKSETTLEQLNELGSEFMDRLFISDVHASLYFFICWEWDIWIVHESEYKVLSVWIQKQVALEFHVGNIYVHLFNSAVST